MADAAGAIAVLTQPSPDWDAFVAMHPQAPPYMRSDWACIAREVFGHEVVFFEARDATGRLVGILPVVRQKSRLLGTFATSLPFFNYGGVLCDSHSPTLQLMHRAQEWAAESGCAYLEFRHSQPLECEWPARTDKVSMLLELPADFTELSKRLGSKLRSQVKRSEREQPTVRTGGVELLGDFYSVFALNMRDLGTPVYPRRFFEAILRRFADQCRLVVIDRNGTTEAAGFLVFAGNGTAEIPWAACSAYGKTLGFNMKLYWEALSLSVARGCHAFDFGRSTVDSGTYRFKKQWGAQPRQLYWHRWERHPRSVAGQAHSHGRVMSYATRIWQKLPLPIANALGPLVSPSLPW